ncbi:MAG: enoyl-CoA hydratase/isomerase family protein [Chloroflexi bacterium]|nr:enoyl-CoA hydratase/isomerase family protein [Chloroflexota bacterium]
MAESGIRMERDGAVVRLTLNRPETGNTLDLSLAQELAAAYRAISDDAAVLAVVLTGQGDFSVGEDPSLWSLEGDAEYRTLVRRWQADAVEGAAQLQVPVVAAIAGRCADMGLELALACDMRLAADTATFTMPQVGRGDLPHWGGTQRLPRLVGRGAALDLILLGETIDAHEAYRLGLVRSVVPAADLLRTAMDLARTIASKAPIATRHIREAVRSGMDYPLLDGLRLEADLYFLLQTTEDRAEGIRAFLERRPPHFQGR